MDDPSGPLGGVSSILQLQNGSGGVPGSGLSRNAHAPGIDGRLYDNIRPVMAVEVSVRKSRVLFCFPEEGPERSIRQSMSRSQGPKLANGKTQKV